MVVETYTASYKHLDTSPPSSKLDYFLCVAVFMANIILHLCMQYQSIGSRIWQFVPLGNINMSLVSIILYQRTQPRAREFGWYLPKNCFQKKCHKQDYLIFSKITQKNK
jgi:hypothetical protein